jgi:pre-rRNA-processing protein TSR1
MNYKITPYYEEEDKYIQNLNKKVLECQCGFRRYLIKPIFSVNLHNSYSDKIKYQKYIEKDKFFIMTCFSQLTYANNPVLIFLRKKEDNFDNNLNLCGTGITLESDSKKIILKKIILTGYPVKIKKKKAVVRYMFFNPEDINYFKPIQLVTKNGLRGNIKESVGTHGYMKCYFSDYLKSNDTVCLNLYKRIFPKWFIETWKYKIFNGDREDYFKLFENNFK